MKHLLIGLSVLFLIIYQETIVAQKVWTLEACISYALENNIQIKRQVLQTGIAKNNLTQSKIDLLPDLNAGGNHTIGSGRILNDSYTYSNKTNNGSIGLQSSVTIFNGFQKLNTIKLNRYSYLAALEDLEKIKNDISLNIAGSYLQILYNKELHDVAKNQLEVTKLQIEKTTKLYEVGNVARGSLLDIQATAAVEEANVIDAENSINLSYLSLAQMLDLDTLKGFSIYIPTNLSVPEIFSDNPDSVFQIALEKMPQIKSSEYYLKRSKSQLAIARGARSPQISLTGYYNTQYNFYDSINQIEPYPIKDQLNDKIYKQLVFNLSIPLFNKFQIQKNICNAKIQVNDAEYSLRQSQLQLRKDIEQSYADASAAFENYKSRLKAVTAQEENFNYVQQKFDIGLISSVDYIVAKNNYIKVKSDLLRAKYDFIFKTKILEFYKGNVIKL